MVWQRHDGSDWEIYLMRGVVPLPAICGDGLIELFEDCDDADTAPGDGCDAGCKIESGWTCEGEPSVCTAVRLPSISFGGLALLAGLVLGTAAWARRGS